MTDTTSHLSPAETDRLLTGEELARLGDIGPCELVDGRIVRMSPKGYRHGRIEARIAAVLSAFVDAGGLGEVLTGEVGVFTGRDPDHVRAADVLYISHGTAARRSEDQTYLDVAPELVVEILSPEDRTEEVTQKLREYFAIGVGLVWIVDPDARSVLAYRSVTDVRQFRAGDLLPGDEVLPGFLAPVATLFNR